MLSHLHVKNLALIEEIEVEFGPGLNILTGETGAGKSILLGSMQLILGAKTSKNMIRENAPYALVELLFQVENEKALEALGDILHAVYSNKNGMTTVGQETALLKSYVDIMQMRFGSSFQYYNVIPTELFYYEIPAFTMQPIVENAILHGVKGVTAGQIIVSAIEYENDFVISVFNNGNSADKKKIEDLLKGEKNQRAVTGIGLYNVNSRLKLLYGESYGLIYNEKVRNGFEIWVRLPKKITESEER